MIRIFNVRTKNEILIDENCECVEFAPRDYLDDSPYLEINLKGFDLMRHADSCEDCKAFTESLGRCSRDWYVSYLGKTKMLDTVGLSKDYNDNLLQHAISDYFHGTRLRLKLSKDTIESLETELQEAVCKENYEKACVLRDAIIRITENEVLS
jgi:hypothetical protein